MTTNHTPGRLRIKAAINGDVAVITEADDVVAEFFADVRYVGENARDTARANALLFVGASGLLDSLLEILNLCAIGDVDESTEAYGWGDAIKRANARVTQVTGLPQGVTS